MESEYWIPIDQVIYAVVYKQTGADIKSKLCCCPFLLEPFRPTVFRNQYMLI